MIPKLKWYLSFNKNPINVYFLNGNLLEVK